MADIRKALVAAKLDDLPYLCVAALYSLRAVGLEEIVFAHVVDRDEVAFVPYAGFDRDLAQELRNKAELRFQDWGAEAARAGVRPKVRVEIGRPATKLLEIAEEEGVDLVLLGRHQPGLADRLFLGGTGMEVLRRSRAPVFVCRLAPEDGAACARNVYDHVLLATDFSAPSRPVFAFLRRLSGLTRRVSVVHVVPEEALSGRSQEQIDAEDARLRGEVEKTCAAVRALGMEADGHLLGGNPSREILRAAADLQANLVLMGTLGRGGFQEFLLGSVSHRVAELAPVSVVLVPMREEAS